MYIFFRHSSIEVQSRRQFKFVQSANMQSNSTKLILCQQCSNHLTLDSTPRAKDRVYERSTNTRPTFIWYFLTNQHLHCKYGTHLWQFIPFTWQHWWIEDALLHFRREITLLQPDCIFVDKSKDNKNWNDDITSMYLARLRDTSYKYLMPCILCPWGCSEYTHK